jgi:hypothetical protein
MSQEDYIRCIDEKLKIFTPGEAVYGTNFGKNLSL